MLLSMTGFGDARTQTERLTVAAEIRTVNNRYLKISARLSDSHAALEGDVERVVRQAVSRGTVSVSIRVHRQHDSNAVVLNEAVLRGYWSALERMSRELGAPAPRDLSVLLSAPGVIQDEATVQADVAEDWPVLESTLQQALGRLQTFRQEEGRAMGLDLRENIHAIGGRLGDISQFAPLLVTEYRNRLLERVRGLLHDSNVPVHENDLIREVSMFADRTDINEEITRLRCHLEQFTAFLDESTSAGRKLDFLTQEMFREINTIGSKANSVAVAHDVVAMKAALERVREVLQNVE